jgi:hypothetical protein
MIQTHYAAARVLEQPSAVFEQERLRIDVSAGS